MGDAFVICVGVLVSGCAGPETPGECPTVITIENAGTSLEEARFGPGLDASFAEVGAFARDLDTMPCSDLSAALPGARGQLEAALSAAEARGDELTEEQAACRDDALEILPDLWARAEARLSSCPEPSD